MEARGSRLPTGRSSTTLLGQIQCPRVRSRYRCSFLLSVKLVAPPPSLSEEALGTASPSRRALPGLLDIHKFQVQISKVDNPFCDQPPSLTSSIGVRPTSHLKCRRIPSLLAQVIINQRMDAGGNLARCPRRQLQNIKDLLRFWGLAHVLEALFPRSLRADRDGRYGE